jgi:alanyl-tRNA synthetase
MCNVASGSVKVGDTLKASVDATRRQAIARNHSAVHMLQAALRKVLGNHVEQAGSYVDENIGRFDFTHFAALTSEEIAKIENLVNAYILSGGAIETVETDIDTARANGAMALFGEKYGKVVRMVKMGDFSVELCGGTHLDNSAKAGMFKIVSESSVAAGVRRIEITTGYGVLNLLASKDALILDTAKELKCQNVNDIAKRATAVSDEVKALKREIDQLNSKLAGSRVDELINNAKVVNGISVITADLGDMNVDAVRSLGDSIKDKKPESVAVFAIHSGEKLNFIAVCGKAAVAKGAHAGNILREVSAVTGGRGGGRPDSAMSGGKDISKIADALALVETLIK